MNPSSYPSLSPDEWASVESAEHDRIYADMPLAKIDTSAFLAYEDYCYMRGARRDRGHRTRRALSRIGLGSLSGKTLLDVGCGDGRYSVFLSLMGATVHGFDLSRVGVQHANQLARLNGRAQSCQFSVQNASCMGYADETFDIVLLHEVLHHAVKYPGVHEEVLRVLRPGGTVVITESLYGHRALNWARRFTMRGQEAKGDVVLRLADIERFAVGFSSADIELMSLTFMAKRVVERWVDAAAIRALMYLLKRFDDALLYVIPPLRRYCGECVVVLQK